MGKAEFVENELSRLLQVADKRIAYAEYIGGAKAESVNVVRKNGEIIYRADITDKCNLLDIAKDIINAISY